MYVIGDGFCDGGEVGGGGGCGVGGRNKEELKEMDLLEVSTSIKSK